jgi:hypothetical protein
VQENRQNDYAALKSSMSGSSEVSCYTHFTFAAVVFTVPALAPQDQDAVDQTFEDQGMDVRYDEPIPYNSPDSDYETDDDDDNNNNNSGLSGLSKHISGW